MSEITKEMVAERRKLAELIDARWDDSHQVTMSGRRISLARHEVDTIVSALTAALSVSRPQESGTVCPSCRETCARVAEQEANEDQAEQLEHGFGAIFTPLMAYNLGRHQAGGDIRTLPAHSTEQRAATEQEAYEIFVDGFQSEFRIEKPDLVKCYKAGVRALLAALAPPLPTAIKTET